MIVVDASVAVKAIAREADAERALAFFDQHRDTIVAPDLLLSEVSGAIVRRVNAREMRIDEGHTVLAEWAAAVRDRLVRLYRVTPERVEEAAVLAISLGHPLPDCIYLALALELGCDLVTCDAKFRAKAGPHQPCIRLLADVA